MKPLFPSLSLAIIGAVGASAQNFVPAGPITVLNPLSQFPITVDGQFNGGAVNPGPPISLFPLTEWSDVTPLAFISPPVQNGPLLSVPLGSPGVNSLLYAAVAPGVAAASAELYLMYDYLPRTNPGFGPSEFIADIQFPLTIGANKFPDSVVQFRGHNPGLNPAGVSFFDVFVDLDGGGAAPPLLAGALGIDEAVVGFGPSTLSMVPHMLIELEVELNIPAGFGSPGGPFPPDGTHGQGLYSPEPAFWIGNSAKDSGDPPSSGAIFTINPNGSTLIVAAVPESSTLTAVALSGILGFQLWRRRRG